MKNLRTLILSGTVLSLVAAGGAFAQTTSTPSTSDQKPAAATSSSQKTGAQKTGKSENHSMRRHHKGRMARMDKNNDGGVQLDEMTRRTDRLKKADTDGDGTLSKDEIEKMVMKRMVERRARRMERRLDVNRDGKVTIAEIQDRQAKRFALADRNNDGKLDRRELRESRMMKRGHHKGRKSGHHGHRGHHGGKKHHGSRG